MIAASLGVLVGLVMGLTGAGGGILAVPALVFALGLPLAEAAPVALFAVAGAAFLGAAQGLRKRLVRYRAASFMAAIGASVSPLGLWLAGVAPERVLLAVFAAIMVFVSVRMFRGAHLEHGQDPTVPLRVNRDTGRLRWTPRTALALAAIAAASGLLTGLFGVGGGFVIVPALRRWSDLAMADIVATSLAVIALVSTASLLASVSTRTPPLALVAPFVAGAAVGMLAGSAGSRRLPPALLQRIFAAVTFAAAIALLVRAGNG